MVEVKEIFSYILLGLSIAIAFIGVYIWAVSLASRVSWTTGTLGAIAITVYLITHD